MADLFGGNGVMGGGAGGGGDVFPLEQWFYETPVCTRWWTTFTVIISVLVQCHVLSPFQLFYSFRAVWNKSEYWRPFTTFLYFGPLSLELLFHTFFLTRYARLLEESAPTSRHFGWLLFTASAALLCLAPLFSMAFLGQALSNTLVYIWSRKNPDVMLSLMGLLVFKAPWLPWVLMGISVVMHGSVPKDEICGVIIGHTWYYMNEVYPALNNNHRPFDPPRWWMSIFEGRQPIVETEQEPDPTAVDPVPNRAPVPGVDVMQ